MANNFSTIEVSVEFNQLGQIESEIYKWIGESPYITISQEFPGVGEKEFQCGPYKLLLVEKDYFSYYTYVRVDKFGRLRVRIYHLTRMLANLARCKGFQTWQIKNML